MKHVHPITRCGAGRADAFQDLICIVFTTFNALLGSFGGSSPFGGFIEEKCTIPVPNDGGNGTG
ncbi:MAG: hypothetical protein HYV27_02160 [Candidatus Hydrogenedentes bacterium]|nr:hypothetical protein [Candidatus Hydrogenedentota bacterium]